MLVTAIHVQCHMTEQIVHMVLDRYKKKKEAYFSVSGTLQKVMVVVLENS